MILQKGSNRLIQFNIDSDSSQEEKNSQKIENQIRQNYSTSQYKNQQNNVKHIIKDKFEISQIKKGMFLYQNEDEDYLVDNKKKSTQKQNKQKKSQPINQVKHKIQEKKQNFIRSNNKKSQFEDDSDLCQEIVSGIKRKNQQFSEQVTSKSMNKMLIGFSDEQQSQQPSLKNDNCIQQQKQKKSIKFQKNKKEDQNEQIDSTQQRINKSINQKNKIEIDGSIIQNIDVFARSPIEKNYILNAIVQRDTSGLNMFGPLYHLMIANILKSVLWSKKVALSSSFDYNFSLFQDTFGGAGSHNIGKIKSNFIGSHFNIYENFYNPNTKTKCKQLRATVVYNNQILSNTPRKFDVYLINGEYSYSSLEGVTPEVQYNINDLYQISSNKEKIDLFSNREPIWSQKLNGYILNFNGRIDKPSIKNFILQKPQTKEQVLMFGKVGEDRYNIYISNPLSPFIGLAIALTHFDNKFLYQ